VSLIEAISGLFISSSNIDLVSNNIANASTIGFKSSTLSLHNIVSDSFESTEKKTSGVGISNFVQNFNNGAFIETGKDLDLSISNNGFFRVLDSNGQVHYTRNGQFLIDKNFNIVNFQGMYLTGRNNSLFQRKLSNSSNLEPINLKNYRILKAKPTTKITLSPILNSDVHLNNTENIEKYNTQITIYNKDGQPQILEINFAKNDLKKWRVHIKSKNVFNNSSEQNIIDKICNLEFDDNGKLSSSPNFDISLNDKFKNNKITLDFTGTVESSNNKDLFLNAIHQDGYEQGSLKTLNVLKNGKIISYYSNQKTQEISQIVLSKFVNPEKLKPESGNVWSATKDSGKEEIGNAGCLGFGEILSKTLETSNVDLNKELINMIVAQRNYQSSAQAFKAEDKIVNTLINL